MIINPNFLAIWGGIHGAAYIFGGVEALGVSLVAMSLITWLVS